MPMRKLHPARLSFRKQRGYEETDKVQEHCKQYMLLVLKQKLCEAILITVVLRLLSILLSSCKL